MLLAAFLLSLPTLAVLGLLALLQVPELALEQALPLLLQAVQGGPGALALGLAAGLVLVLQAVKRYGARLHPVFAQKGVLVALALLVPVASALTLHLASGGALTLGVVASLVLNGLLGGLSAMGLYSGGKALGEAAAAQIRGTTGARLALEAAAKAEAGK